jgi:hypothetical protein
MQLFVDHAFHCSLDSGWRMYDFNILLELCNRGFFISTHRGDLGLPIPGEG